MLYSHPSSLILECSGDYKLQHKLYQKMRPLFPAKMPHSKTKGKSFKRVGFVSNYFHSHSVGRCFVGLFEYLKQNHPDIEVVISWPWQWDDELTKHIKESSHSWIRSCKSEWNP